MNDYLAEVKPRYGIGHLDYPLQAENAQDAVEVAKSYVRHGQELLRVYEVNGSRGNLVWGVKE